jgi:hypothetical protein
MEDADAVVKHLIQQREEGVVSVCAADAEAAPSPGLLSYQTLAFASSVPFGLFHQSSRNQTGNPPLGFCIPLFPLFFISCPSLRLCSALLQLKAGGESQLLHDFPELVAPEAMDYELSLPASAEAAQGGRGCAEGCVQSAKELCNISKRAVQQRCGHAMYVLARNSHRLDSPSS